MSVDFYGCDSCGDSRFEDLISECAKCGHYICDDCMMGKPISTNTPPFIGERSEITDEDYEVLCEKYGKHIVDNCIIGMDYLNPEYCPFCNGEKVHDSDLLYFALSLLTTTKQELIERYLKSKNK